MNSNNPTISICIPTIGTSPYLMETIESVRHAACQGCELILLDNLNNPPVDENLLKDMPIPCRLVRTTSRLIIGESWNFALSISRGEWVHILHDDDWVEPEFYTVARGSGNTKQGIWFCGTFNDFEQKPSDNFESRFPTRGPCHDHALLSSWLFEKSLSRCVSTILNKKQAETLGGFDVALRQLVDLDLFWRLSESAGAWLCDQTLGHYRIHPSSITGLDISTRSMPFLDDGRILHDWIHIMQHLTPEARRRTAIDHYSRQTLLGAFRYYVLRGRVRHAALMMRALAVHMRCFHGVNA